MARGTVVWKISMQATNNTNFSFVPNIQIPNGLLMPFPNRNLKKTCWEQMKNEKNPSPLPLRYPKLKTEKEKNQGTLSAC
jgi:hypothetical protein